MGIGTALHEKTAPLCESMKWKEWAGYFAVERYGVAPDEEYFAIRQTAGLLDVSPLYKYDLMGPDALRLVDRVLARDATRLKDGQVAYCCWCDDDGKVIDDGTVFRFHTEHFRLSAANPNLAWLSANADGLRVTLEDTSASVAAMAFQGPASRTVLNRVSDSNLDKLRYFRMMKARVAGVPVMISRTGFTGDLGYEVWADAREAGRVWDAILEAGRPYGAIPAGLLALDMARVEAGFILADVDYTCSFHALVDDQKSSPFEIGLGWTVHLDKAPFVGQKALQAEKKRGSAWSLVGLEVDIEELEALFDARGLPLHLPQTAWRSIVPLYDPQTRRQMGRATSGVWSQILKKNLCLASVESKYSKPGTEMKIESLIDYEREWVTARVVPTPFYDPPQKKA